MKRFLTLAIASFLLAIPALCADDKKPTEPAKQVEKKESFDALLNDMVGVMKKATEALKKAKDAASAKAAKPEVEKVVAELKGIQKRFEQAGKPSKEEEANLEKKHKQSIEEAVKALQAEAMRLAKSDYGKELIDILQSKTKPGDK